MADTGGANKEPHLRGKRAEKATDQNFVLAGTVNNIIERGQTRKKEKQENRLQKEEDQNNMQPIWDSQRRLRMNTTAKDIAIKKTYGAECHGMKDTMKRWEEWAEECFRKKRTNNAINRTDTRTRMGKRRDAHEGRLTIHPKTSIAPPRTRRKNQKQRHGSTKNRTNRTLAEN